MNKKFALTGTSGLVAVNVVCPIIYIYIDAATTQSDLIQVWI